MVQRKMGTVDCMEGPIFHGTVIAGKESSTFQVRWLLAGPIYSMRYMNYVYLETS